jgi:DNA-binding transcriptional ArsR family regulator
MTLNQELRDEINRLHANVCAGLADPTRILILYTLSDGPHPVGEIVRMLDVNQPTISRHLQVLRERDLVTSQREGHKVFYSLSDERIIQALDLLRAVLADNLQKQVALASNVNPSPESAPDS